MIAKTFLPVLLALFILTDPSSAFAQDKTLVGKITTFDSIPLIGVNIEVKSTGREVKTDSLGRFQLFCNQEDRLKIEADGFYSQKVKVEENIRMILVNLTLKKGNKNIEQAERYVNVGYGYVNSKELLYAVANANTNDDDFSRYDTVFDAIQGQFPGVMVSNGQIIVRGTTTLMGVQGDAALIVIDGAISNSGDLLNVSPHDVSSIDVMKDGSSSVYGSRGANGVVMITTKKGNN